MTKTKILLVDDRPENLVALESLLAGADVETLSAQSGNDALALLIGNEFALALVDVQMPTMSGFELARIMRSAERSKAIPIIFVTASRGEEHEIFEGYEKGAVDFLLKPLNAHVVRSKVRVFVELDQKNRQLRENTKVLAAKLREVEGLHQAAEAANHAKTRFLANISHEIRTPLGAVLGYAELLMIEDQADGERRTNVDAIKRNGRQLLALIDDVLDLAKIEAGRVEVERTNVALSDVLADLHSVHAHKAAEKGIALTVTASGPLPRTVATDPLRFKQILNNLVGNALKFTERGQVSLAVTCEGLPAAPRVCIAVRDTGRGLAPSESGRLFQPFMQADASTTRIYGGTGLGLVISKQLARLLGGDVILSESTPGAGSTFTLTVDAGPEAAGNLVDGAELLRSARFPPAGADAAMPRIDGTRVLLVDDALDNRHLISRILKVAGATVETASDGVEAVELALQGRFDIVLMDIQMPRKDGYSATMDLRASGFRTPIIALTAHALRDELERCLAAGCNEYLSKPVDYRQLLTTIARHVLPA